MTYHFNKAMKLRAHKYEIYLKLLRRYRSFGGLLQWKSRTIDEMDEAFSKRAYRSDELPTVSWIG
ncbi:hypothetical protein KXD40_007345 [Peronospora effusa]|uniref:Uncharacterized protein n=1 Tax=Peronospora effusa TaxID=542832 RepID=A0A3M6VCA6_9STRA|nr:hypothetical protein DD238_005924 [Peronospora effusa]UIZ28910.1 hypothetical protein KXD40_007345 [Peronospora effusa]